MEIPWLLLLISILAGMNLILLIWYGRQQQRTDVAQQLVALQMALTDRLGRTEQQLATVTGDLQTRLTAQLQQQQQAQQQTLATTLASMGQQMQQTLTVTTDTLSRHVTALTRTTDQRLHEISGQVEHRLQAGFDRTNETFTRVLEHLSRIDEAQKKITELSGQVVSLQAILDDKRSRGAFGEVQLQALIQNLMPTGSFTWQATLSNGRRVDCLLHLPAPTGQVPIDAKFPLEGYQQLQTTAPTAQNTAQFRRDIRKHIRDIADKYLIPGETADGAVMFIPAEAVFAEIHAHYPELVAEAQQARVWLVSPTTLMAVLTTARAVLKDDATRQQVHIIQEHLHKLSADFNRFQQRMDKLASHIRQANDDVGMIHTSAQKISRRFAQIEAAELTPAEQIKTPATDTSN